MRRLLAVAPLMLAAAACGPQSSTTQSRAEQPNADPESGEGRAFEAGRALIGKPAPAALLHTIDGRTIDLAKLHGRKPVYLKFWATWCIPCREQMPAFEGDFEKYRHDMVTVAVNTGFNDDVDAVRRYRLEHGLKMPIAVDDGTLGAALNLRVTPQHVVIGRDGRILYVGHLEDDGLHAAFRRAIAERPSAAPVPGRLERAPSLGGVEAELARAAGFPLSGASRDARPRILIFFSPWCEEYWRKSRPAFSAACRRVREGANQLAAGGTAHLLGIASGLWASQKDLSEFRTRDDSYHMPLYLDSSGAAFRAFGVRQVPTVIVLDEAGRIKRRLGLEDAGMIDALSASGGHE